MAYKRRDQQPGFHHVAIRGNNKRTIFRDAADRTLFLQLLNPVAKRHGWAIYAYCLMRNHYHLVIRVSDGGLAPGMCKLNTAYAVQFNRRHGRINHLFGRRYWSDFLVTDRRLLNAVRYVVQNPRRAGRKGPLERHAWTSYPATIGLAASPVRVAAEQLLVLFHPVQETAIEEFRAFCEEPADPQERWQPPSQNRSRAAT